MDEGKRSDEGRWDPEQVGRREGGTEGGREGGDG